MIKKSFGRRARQIYNAQPKIHAKAYVRSSRRPIKPPEQCWRYAASDARDYLISKTERQESFLQTVWRQQYKDA